MLVGKAREVYSAMSVEQSSQYDHAKKTVLKAYELVPEAYGQNFRNCRKQDKQTYTELAREKEALFNRWYFSRHTLMSRRLITFNIQQYLLMIMPRLTVVHLLD